MGIREKSISPTIHPIPETDDVPLSCLPIGAGFFAEVQGRNGGLLYREWFRCYNETKLKCGEERYALITDQPHRRALSCGQ